LEELGEEGIRWAREIVRELQRFRDHVRDLTFPRGRAVSVVRVCATRSGSRITLLMDTGENLMISIFHTCNVEQSVRKVLRSIRDDKYLA